MDHISSKDAIKPVNKAAEDVDNKPAGVTHLDVYKLADIRQLLPPCIPMDIATIVNLHTRYGQKPKGIVGVNMKIPHTVVISSVRIYEKFLCVWEYFGSEYAKLSIYYDSTQIYHTFDICAYVKYIRELNVIIYFGNTPIQVYVIDSNGGICDLNLDIAIPHTQETLSKYTGHVYLINYWYDYRYMAPGARQGILLCYDGTYSLRVLNAPYPNGGIWQGDMYAIRNTKLRYTCNGEILACDITNDSWREYILADDQLLYGNMSGCVDIPINSTRKENKWFARHLVADKTTHTSVHSILPFWGGYLLQTEIMPRADAHTARYPVDRPRTILDSPNFDIPEREIPVGPIQTMISFCDDCPLMCDGNNFPQMKYAGRIGNKFFMYIGAHVYTWSF